MKSTFIEIVIKIANAKDFVFCFMDKPGKKVKIFPYDKKLTVLGNLWHKKLNKLVPELKVYFVGSSALKLPGHKDLDFVIESSKEDVIKSKQKLRKTLGRPYKSSENYTEWRKKVRGISIDILLSYKKDRMYLRMMDAFNVLNTNKKMRTKYLKLKLAMNGKSYKEYELKRSFLFNEIFYKYGSGLDFIFK